MLVCGVVKAILDGGVDETLRSLMMVAILQKWLCWQVIRSLHRWLDVQVLARGQGTRNGCEGCLGVVGWLTCMTVGK